MTQNIHTPSPDQFVCTQAAGGIATWTLLVEHSLEVVLHPRYLHNYGGRLARYDRIMATINTATGCAEHYTLIVDKVSSEGVEIHVISFDSTTGAPKAPSDTDLEVDPETGLFIRPHKKSPDGFLELATLLAAVWSAPPELLTQLRTAANIGTSAEAGTAWSVFQRTVPDSIQSSMVAKWSTGAGAVDKPDQEAA